MNLLVGILMIVACACAQSIFSRNRFRRFPGDSRGIPRISLKQRFTNRIMQHRQRNTARVCYDTVGCFEVPHSRSPLQKTPEAPETLDTKFFLFRRNINFSEPEVIYYDDGGKSLSESKFNFEQPLRIFIHGYMSRWNERGAFVFADSFLKMNDSNFIVMDWSKGARGPQYTTAAANTELAGRQLGILLMAMINNGLSSKKIHLIGFSLGAHVAGCASELLKSNGKMLGRITGLDAAGPLFRHNHLKERSKKLDISDADFVDVLHTDSSPVFVDGFGLWEPIGHVDYFANGGQEQPGCTDRHPSVVVTTLERTLSRDTACSHIRAVHLFLEYLQNKLSGNGCEFTAFKCPGGLPSFIKGQCFPQLGDRETDKLALSPKYHDLGTFGEPGGDGVMYFVTRSNSQFCGTQLQAIIDISPKTEAARGMLSMKMLHGNFSTRFSFNFDFSESVSSPLYSIKAAQFESMDSKVESVSAYVSFIPLEDSNNDTSHSGKSLTFDKLMIRDMYGHSWSFCGGNTVVGLSKADKQVGPVSVKLSRKGCSV